MSSTAKPRTAFDVDKLTRAVLDGLSVDAPVLREACARVVAFRLHKRGLPAHYIFGSHLLNSPGFTRHYDLGAAGGGHSDPTTDGATWHHFCTLVEAELQRGGFRDKWIPS